MNAQEFEQLYPDLLNEISEIVKPEYHQSIQYLRDIKVSEMIPPTTAFTGMTDARATVWYFFGISCNVFKITSKCYRLLKTSVNLADITTEINDFINNNIDITSMAVQTIPNQYIQSYSELCIEGDQNTVGMLASGETSKFTVKYVVERYNTRSTPDKLCFDILIIDNQTNDVVGKVNSWGFTDGLLLNIAHLYIKESHRGRGIGRFLILSTIDFAVQNMRNLTSFHLQTQEYNHSAQHIISGIGFTEDYPKNLETIKVQIGRLFGLYQN